MIDDDNGLHDVSASVCIIGGGPHALAVLSALHEGSLSFEQYTNDNMFEQRVGFNSHEKIGTVCVIDPGARFMESWNSRFEALEIQHLRSPAFAHPVPFEATALLNYAVKEGRTNELIDEPAVSKWLAGGGHMSQQDSQLKALPTQALFRDFCASVETKMPHEWLSGHATAVCKDSVSGKFRVHYRASADQRERKVVARAVILATGPSGMWNVPAPFKSHLSSPLIIHTEELIAKGNGTLREEVTRRCRAEPGSTVLVVGGGLSAAQAALAAVHAGQRVVLRSRRPLTTRAFDIATEWLDARHADRLRFEFWSLPVEKRRAACREATSGGSVPARYMEELHRIASQDASALKIEVDAEIEGSKVGVDDSQVIVNDEAFAMVILATGVSPAPSGSSLYQSVQELLDAPTVDGLPHVDTSLRWSPEEDLFVMGIGAMLELGPGGGNLMGAMRGAKLVANELHHLMWKQNTTDGASKARAGTPKIFANHYAALLGGESGDDSEGASSEDEEELTTERSAVLPPSPLCSPPSKKPKASKARKHRKATKGRRGMG